MASVCLFLTRKTLCLTIGQLIMDCIRRGKEVVSLVKKACTNIYLIKIKKEIKKHAISAESRNI